MTYAEVIGISAEGQIPTSDTGSLTEFLGGLPDGEVYDPGLTDTFLLSDETTYFAAKEVNFGDILIVVRAMHNEAERHCRLDCKEFASFVMEAAMMTRRRDCKDEMEFRDFCAELNHEFGIVLEQYLGVYEPDRRPHGRDKIRDFTNYDDEMKAQLSYDAALELARKNSYFPLRRVKYLDVCVVLEAMQKQAVIKGMNARRFARDAYGAALNVVQRKEPYAQAFRAFCAEQKRKLRDHLDAYLIAHTRR